MDVAFLVEGLLFTSVSVFYLICFVLSLRYEYIASSSRERLQYHTTTMDTLKSPTVIEKQKHFDYSNRPAQQNFPYYARRWGIFGTLLSLPWAIDIHGANGWIPDPWNDLLPTSVQSIYLAIFSSFVWFTSKAVYRGMNRAPSPCLRSCLIVLPLCFLMIGWSLNVVSFVINRAFVDDLYSCMEGIIVCVYIFLLVWIYIRLGKQIRQMRKLCTTTSTPSSLSSASSTSHPLSSHSLVPIDRAYRRLKILVGIVVPCGLAFGTAFIWVASQGLRIHWQQPTEALPPPISIFDVPIQIAMDVLAWAIMGSICWFAFPRVPKSSISTNDVSLPALHPPPPPRVHGWLGAPGGGAPKSVHTGMPGIAKVTPPKLILSAVEEKEGANSLVTLTKNNHLDTSLVAQMALNATREPRITPPEELISPNVTPPSPVVFEQELKE